MRNSFPMLPPGTRKQLTVGYCLLSFLFVLCWMTGFGGWAFDAFLRNVSDPVVRAFFWLAFVLFLPGMVIVAVVGGVLLWCIGFSLVVALSFIWTPLLMFYKLASISAGGAVLGIVFLGAYIWGALYFYRHHKHEAIDGLRRVWAKVIKYVRDVVEFFAWISFLLEALGFRSGQRPKQTTSSLSTDEERPSEGNMPDQNELVFVTAEIVSLRKNYPELPAFHDNGYEGWFVEAKKLFQMQSYNRTQAERVEVLKKIAELNGLYLQIARQMGEKTTFEQEQRLRAKRMNVEEVELDHKMEDLLADRELKRRERMKEPEPPAPPKNPVDEELNRIRKTLRTAAGVEAECEELAKEFPKQDTYIRRQTRKIVADLMERA